MLHCKLEAIDRDEPWLIHLYWQWDKERLVIVPWLSPTPLPALHFD